MKHTRTSILLAAVVCASGQASSCSDATGRSSWATQLSSLLHRLPSFKLPSCSMPSLPSMPSWYGFSLSQRHKEQVKTWAPVIGVAAGASIATGCYYYWLKTHKPTATPQSQLTPLVILTDQKVSPQPTSTSPVASPKPSASPRTPLVVSTTPPGSPINSAVQSLVSTAPLSPVRTSTSPSGQSSTPPASPKAIEPATTSPKTPQATKGYCPHLSCSEFVDSCLGHPNTQQS